MNEASKTCDPMICEDLVNATFLQVSAAGLWPYVGPDGLIRGACGPAVALANLSARQVKALGLLTSGTYGPHGSTSSASAALSTSLASRLRARLLSLGSTLYTLTWKERDTPSGRPIYALRASTRRTSANDCIGTPWPTTQGRDGAKGRSGTPSRTGGRRRNLDDYVTLVLPASVTSTPRANDAEKRGTNMADDPRNGLVTAANLASPRATPRAEDAESSGARHSRGVADTLTAQTALASPRATPTTRDWKDGASTLENTPVNALLGRQVLLTDSGATSIGSPAATEKRGRLNPAHSRWLQGYPPAWDACGVTAMQSTSKRRSRSSAPWEISYDPL